MIPIDEARGSPSESPPQRSGDTLVNQGEGLLATNPFEGGAGKDLLLRRRERSPKASHFWLAGTKEAWFGANWPEPIFP
jgi:hypothetical protein